jgi:hypothetical protein
MPTVRKLTPGEVQTIENRGKGLRKLIGEEYDQFLAEYAAGDYGEALVAEDEKRLTVRNRFKAAAGRRGLALYFIRTGGNTIRFKVMPGDEQPARQPKAQGRAPARGSKPVASDTPPATRRGPGRPRKATT